MGQIVFFKKFPKQYLPFHMIFCNVILEFSPLSLGWFWKFLQPIKCSKTMPRDFRVQIEQSSQLQPWSWGLLISGIHSQALTSQQQLSCCTEAKPHGKVTCMYSCPSQLSSVFSSSCLSYQTCEKLPKDSPAIWESAQPQNFPAHSPTSCRHSHTVRERSKTVVPWYH